MKDKKRYAVVEVSNPMRSWVRNERTGEERPEILSTLASTDSLAAATKVRDRHLRAMARQESPIEFGHDVKIWDRASEDWDAFIESPSEMDFA